MGQFDPNNQMIPLTVIQLTDPHRTFKTAFLSFWAIFNFIYLVILFLNKIVSGQSNAGQCEQQSQWNHRSIHFRINFHFRFRIHYRIHFRIGPSFSFENGKHQNGKLSDWTVGCRSQYDNLHWRKTVDLPSLRPQIRFKVKF